MTQKTQQIDNKPRISIIIAVLNSVDTLTRCLESITSQTYPNIELIVIDGGSTDGSLTILETQFDKIAYLESKRDNGIYHAWNKAIEKAHGEWICFIGADDFFWSPDTLTDIIPHLVLAHKLNMRFVYGKTAIISRMDGKTLFIDGNPWNYLKKGFTQKNTLIHTGTFHHESLFKRHGRFDENYKIAGDYDFLLRELIHNDAYFASDQVVVGMTLGGIGTRFDKKIQTAKEFLRARKNNNIKGIPWSLYIWLIKIFIFKILKPIFGKNNTIRIDEIFRIIFTRFSKQVLKMGRTKQHGK